jgi:hypothetical protein
MPVDIQRLREENAKSIAAVDHSISRLRDLLDEGPPLSVALDINAQLNRAQSDKIHLQLLRGHLQAALAVVAPISPAVQARLDELSARLDQAILNDFAINATFAVIRRVLGAAEEISDITSAHTA